MKKLLYICLCIALLAGCTKENNNVDNGDSSDIIVESSSTDSYPTIISSKGTRTREVFNTVFQNNEQDFYKIGKGLEFICQNTYPVSSYSIKESEHLTYTVGTEMIGDYFHIMKRPEVYATAINPPAEENVDGVVGCKLFSALYAVDFYKNTKEGTVLGGMGITAVITPDYLNTETAVTYTYSDATIEKYAKEAISKIYKYYYEESSYEELKTLPIVVMVYKQCSTVDDYDGRYLYYAVCQNGTVGEIQNVNQKTYVFYSDASNKADSATSSEFTLFKSKLKENSVEAIGIVGIGQYYDGKIYSMTIDINSVCKVYDEFKAIGDYVAQLLNNNAFNEDFEIKVRINNNTRTIGWVIKEKGEKAKFYML